jgi:DNA-binding transcriptional ArsR family regulator
VHTLADVSRVHGDAQIAQVAAAIGDEARARILLTLNDGRALPASVLASEAGVAPSTASEHLHRLLDAGLVSAEPKGRHRYYRLSGPEVGGLLETLSQLAPGFQVRSLREGTRAEALRRVRTCYDHLAGRLGVAIFESMYRDGLIDADGDGYSLTHGGHAKLERLGIEVPGSALRHCIDWTEQRPHLSGAVGRALATRLFELEWLERLERTRAVRVTPGGRRGLALAFGESVLA